MTNTSNTDEPNYLDKWQSYSFEERNKLIYDIVYGNEELPFSSTVPPIYKAKELAEKLSLLGVEIKQKKLPRSTLSIISYGDVELQPMPYDKAVCLIILVLEDEIRSKVGGE